MDIKKLLRSIWRKICTIIRRILAERIERSWKVHLFLKTYAPLTPIYLADNEYEILSKDELEELVKKTYRRVKDFLKKYKLEDCDCDDWAAAFYFFAKVKSIRAIGIAWSIKHAFIVSIAYCDGKPELLVIEPQTSKIYTYYEAIKMDLYKPRWRFVLM